MPRVGFARPARRGARRARDRPPASRRLAPRAARMHFASHPLAAGCWRYFLEFQLVNLLRVTLPLFVHTCIMFSSGTVHLCLQHEEHALLARVRLEGSGSARTLSPVCSLPPLLARSLGLARESELREQQTREQQQLFLYYEAAAARRRSAAGRDAAWDAVVFERRAPTAEQLARIYPPLEVRVLLCSIFLPLLEVIFTAVSSM